MKTTSASTSRTKSANEPNTDRRSWPKPNLKNRNHYARGSKTSDSTQTLDSSWGGIYWSSFWVSTTLSSFRCSFRFQRLLKVWFQLLYLTTSSISSFIWIYSSRLGRSTLTPRVRIWYQIAKGLRSTIWRDGSLSIYWRVCLLIRFLHFSAQRLIMRRVTSWVCWNWRGFWGWVEW